MSISKYSWSRIWQITPQVLLGATLVAMFFNIGIWVENINSFRTGLFDPFVTARVQLFDVFFLLTVLTLLLQGGRLAEIKLRHKEVNKTLLFLGVLILAAAVLGLSPERSGFFILRFVELGMLLWILQSQLLSRDKIIEILTIVGLLQAVLAIIQFINQGSLGLGFLGESQLSPSLPGVAKLSWGSQTFIRGYGTFPHANILGGALTVILALLLLRESKKRWEKIAFGVMSLALVISFSRAAILGLVLAGAFVWLKKTGKINIRALGAAVLTLVILGSVFVARASDTQSLSSRMQGYLRAGQVVIENPILGVGPGNYTMALDSEAELATWERQPAHSVPITMAGELGIPAAVLILALTFMWFKKRMKWAPLGSGTIGLAIFPPLLFDHYFWSTPQGLVIFAVFLFLISDLPRERNKIVGVVSRTVKNKSKRKPYQKPTGIKKFLRR